MLFVLPASAVKEWRESNFEADLEPLFYVFMISSEPFQPTDEDYEKAKEGLPVEPADKLATTWAAIKHRH